LQITSGKTLVSTAKSPSSNDGINSSINESVISAKTNNPKVAAILRGIPTLFKEVGRNFLISPSFYLKVFFMRYVFYSKNKASWEHKSVTI
jgi:hypothetical protein